MSIPANVAYHGVTAAEHQAHFTQLSGQGYRPISLSVYGDPGSPRYAAVWVQRSGPAWQGVHGLSAADYQTAFNTWNAQGYVPLLLTVTGSGNSLVFAGTFEKRTVTGWLTRFGLTDGADTNPSTFQAQNKWALNNNFILRCASLYGDAANRRYAAIWEPNPGVTHWLCRPQDSTADYQTWFNAYTQLPFRPAFVTHSGDEHTLSVFRDDTVGEWHARHGMTAADYQTEFTLRTGQGFYPICVQGGGAGADTRYAVLFAKQDLPNPRQWTVTGQSVPSLHALDDRMKAFMQAHGIHTGQLAVAKNGALKFARAYTWAEPGYPATQTNSVMRLASISKAFTCAAIQKCFDDHLVTPGTAVFPLLGITAKALPTQTPSPWIDTITVQHLIDHAGGWNAQASGWDAVFRLRDIALALNLPGPPSKRDVARYMYGEPLQFQPGTQDFNTTNGASYSNFGYLTLGLVVEHVSGQSYIDYLKPHILAPLGITDVAVAGTLRSQKLPNEVSYDQPSVGAPSTDPHSSTLTPYAYGGEGYMTEVMDSGGGLVSTATDLVKLIHSHAVWGTGGRAAGSARSGGMAGVSSLAVSRTDGIDYAYLFNTRDFPPPVGDPLHDLGVALDGLLTTTPLP